MSIKLFLQKFFASFLIFSLLAPNIALAKGGAASDGQQAARNFMTEDLGIDANDASAFGVTLLKKQVPEVTISIAESSGRQYTAHATVTGIKNQDEAYYTWYLKNDTYRGEESVARNPHTYPVADTVWLGDTIEQYKINATRAYIATQFNPMRYDSPFNGGDDNGDNRDNGILDEYFDNDELDEDGDGIDNNDGDLDDDGRLAFVGGNDAYNSHWRDPEEGESVDDEKEIGTWVSDEDNYCYIYDLSTGIDFELIEAPETAVGLECNSEGWDVVCMNKTTAPGTCAAPTPSEVNTEFNGTVSTAGEGGDGGTAGTGGTGGTPATPGSPAKCDTDGANCGNGGTCDNTGNNCATPAIPGEGGSSGDAGGGGAGGESIGIGTQDGEQTASSTSRNLNQCISNRNQAVCIPATGDDAPESGFIPYCENGIPVCAPTRTGFTGQLTLEGEGGATYDAKQYFDERHARSNSCAAAADDVIAEAIYGKWNRLNNSYRNYANCLLLAASTEDNPDDDALCELINPTVAIEDLSNALADTLSQEICDLIHRMRDPETIGGFPAGGACGPRGTEHGIIEEQSIPANLIIARALSQSTADPNSFECITDTVTTIDNRETDAGCICTAYKVEGCSSEGGGEECIYDFIQTPVEGTELVINENLKDLGYHEPECVGVNLGESFSQLRAATVESAVEQAHLKADLLNLAQANSDNYEDAADEIINACTEEIHLFPGSSGSELNDQDIYTGDGFFTQAEEEFWGMNPENAQTVPESLNDEAIILGVGMKEFTWEYKPGDEIGLVVEGVSLDPSKHDNPWPRTVFAFMDQGCRPINMGGYAEKVRRKNIGFPTAGMAKEELETCMMRNWYEPGEVTENNELTVEISGPDEPITNSQDIPISISATMSIEDKLLENADELRKAHFSWKFYELASLDAASEDGREVDRHALVETDWVPFLTIDSLGEDSDLMEEMHLQTLSGIDYKELNFLANFPETGGASGTEQRLIRVTVDVNAPTDRGSVTRYGRGEFILALVPGADARLQIIPIVRYDATEIQKITPGNFREDPICQAPDPGENATDIDDLDFHICQVIKNEAFAIQIDPAAIGEISTEFGGVELTPDLVEWKIDGQRVFCDPRMYTQCATDFVIFMAPSENNQLHNVSATISNPGSGRLSTKKLSRNIFVKEPSLILTGCDVPDGDDPSEIPDCGAGSATAPKDFGDYNDPTPIVDGVATGNPSLDDQSTQTYRRQDAASFQLNAHFAPNMLNAYAAGAGENPEVETDRVTVVWKMVTAEDSPTQIGAEQTFAVPEYLQEESVEINAKALIQTPEPIRDLLQQHFGLSKESDTLPQFVEAKAIVNEPTAINEAFLTGERYLAIQDEKRHKMRNGTFLATIATNTPEYIIFMIRITITSMILLLVANMAMRSARR